ncbi:unnamed protein product [Meloidogyne enterolobii]|uniref:Uncharacterized protein n=1 Tax=Meloidogyne enterolobii TaxID=390850 RepID=A0ACB0ZSJ3_MELEN
MENQREIQPDVSIECGEFNSRTTSTFLTRIASFLGLKPKAKLPIKRVLINFALIFIFGALIEAFLHILGPFTRGFFCDDNSIRLPYKTGTIPLWMLILYCLLVTNLTVRFFFLFSGPIHSAISFLHRTILGHLGFENLIARRNYGGVDCYRHGMVIGNGGDVNLLETSCNAKTLKCQTPHKPLKCQIIELLYLVYYWRILAFS